MSLFALWALPADGKGGGCDEDSNGTPCQIASLSTLAQQFCTTNNITVAPYRLAHLPPRRAERSQEAVGPRSVLLSKSILPHCLPTRETCVAVLCY